MKIKKIASLTAALSFIMMVLTSFILYIVPQGRIAYWADWHLEGLGSGHAKQLTLPIKWLKNVSETVLIDRFSP